MVLMPQEAVRKAYVTHGRDVTRTATALLHTEQPVCCPAPQ
jgi:hypothetical protein